jgi:hypothetical protein
MEITMTQMRDYRVRCAAMQLARGRFIADTRATRQGTDLSWIGGAATHTGPKSHIVAQVPAFAASLVTVAPFRTRSVFV